MNLSDNLKKIRKIHNLSQEELADKLNVSRQSVSKWESNQAYPEMDKMIQLCKMFNLNIDDLLNNDIGEVNDTKKAKNNINKYVNDFLNYVTKTINMFISMSFKEKIKCLFEQAIIILALVIVANILRSCLGSIFGRLFSFLSPKVYNPIIQVLGSIYSIVCVIVGIMIILNTFKKRYLDYYVIVEKEQDEKEEITKDNKKYLDKKEPKIIIRDPDNSEYTFISAIGKMLIFIIKIFAFGFGIFVISSLVFWSAALVGTFWFAKTGLTFIGALVGTISIICLHYVVLKVLYLFIFNARGNKARLAIMFFAALITLGVSGGVFATSLSSFEIANPSNEKYYIKEENNIKMTKDLVILGYDINYVESDDKDIKVVTKTNKYRKIKVEKIDGGNIYRIIEEENENQPMEVMREMIKDINDKVIIIYDDSEKTIYTNKQNIETLKKNYKDYHNKLIDAQ